MIRSTLDRRVNLPMLGLFRQATLMALLLTAPVLAGDWPTYHHDSQRSNVSDEKLAFPLKLAWSYACAQPPAPAWPDQLNLINRVDFDYASQPVIAEGLICFGSSADDTVRALDAATGEEKWHFITGGPVRLAPQIADGKVYFGSDDGNAYCLSAADGKPIWIFQAAPQDEQLLGNHRMISRWPVRTGVLVEGDVAYCVAGLWSMEGVFIYALHADSGKVIWCNDTSGFGHMQMNDFIGMGVNGHHQGEFGSGGSNPQGPLLANDKALVVPNGFAGPSCFDRETGKPLAREPGGAPGSGGTWLTMEGDKLFCFAKHGQGGNVLVIQDYDLATGKPGRPVRGSQIPQLSIGPKLKPTESHEKGKVSALVHQGKWFVRQAYGIALADTMLLLGQDGAVVAEQTDLQTSAEVRFGLAGDDLAVHARVADRKVIQDATPWKGSCVELFGSMPGKPLIGQIFLVPGTGGEPARAYRAQHGKVVPAPEIRLQSIPTEAGYELSALIPLSLLALDKTVPDYRLEVQVTVTAPDGTVQRDTLFGSTLAYQSNEKFGQVRLRPQVALPSPDRIKAVLARAAPGIIKMRQAAEVWRADVDGEAREMAVADGRLYVTTRRGMVYCFAPAAGHSKPANTHDPAKAIRSAASRVPTGAAARVIDQVRQAGVDRGCALVLGDAEGQLSKALAAHTRLHVVHVLSNESAAAVLREKLLAETTCYGTRIHVQAVPRLDPLPFAQFFANVVIVAGSIEGHFSAGKELYRVLRPCGGLLICPGLTPSDAEALLENLGAPPEEIQRSGDNVRLVRGKLPGALDWDSPKDMLNDQRVKWPLRPLWFGGPTTLETRNFRQGADGPTLGGGRYFIKGEDCLTAVDAYNGEVLWTRPIPKQWIDIRKVDGVLYHVTEPTTYGKQDYFRRLYVNDDSVYLNLGMAYLRGQGQVMIRLDARTGEQRKIYGTFIPPTPVSLDKPQTWPLELDANHSGSVTLENTDRGLVVTLVTKDPLVTKLDAWDLCFDFRPPEVRYGLYERGAFHIRITPALDNVTAASWRLETGPEHPPIDVSGAHEAGGTRTVVLLPWSGLETRAGAKPTSFGFSATLNSQDGARVEPIVRRHLFGDWASDGLNNGWASVMLGGAVPAADAAKPPAIVAGSLKDMKDRDRVRIGVARSGRSLDESVSQAPRIHPLTGDPEPKVYRPSTLCGASFFSDSMMSGRAGIYDFEDDSGLRFVGGVKTRCTTPQVVALGMILVSDETGHCACNYPMRTSLALAPAERRLNEDWALFHDRDADTQVRQAAINLGAPGDRRDDDTMLWLGYPRPPADKGLGYSLAAGQQYAVAAKGVWMRFTPSALQVPLEVESFDGPHAYRPEEDSQTYWKWSTSWIPNRRRQPFGPYRVNADRVKIQGTDRPWIYGSFFRGIRRATLKLNMVKPVASLACEKPPVPDGHLSEAAWSGDPQIVLPFTKTEVLVRHDRDHLYLAARREPVIDRRGSVAPWMKTATGEDAPVWADDSFEVFLADDQGTRVVHLGVSASGARYDALAAVADAEDKAWNGVWRSAVTADDHGLSFELAIPRKTLTEAGLKDRLAINVQINQKDVSGEALKYPGNAGRNYAPKETSGEALCNLGMPGRERCEHFAPLGLGSPAAAGPRTFTVRLHFAELDDVKLGQRVFDVKLQGKAVLKDFDVVEEAGGVHTAVVKEFRHVTAADALTLEFSTSSEALDPISAPILSALEVYDEAFQRERE